MRTVTAKIVGAILDHLRGRRGPVDEWLANMDRDVLDRELIPDLEKIVKGALVNEESWRAAQDLARVLMPNIDEERPERKRLILGALAVLLPEPEATVALDAAVSIERAEEKQLELLESLEKQKQKDRNEND